MPGKELFSCDIEWTPIDPLGCEISDGYIETNYRAFIMRNDVVASGFLDQPKEHPDEPPSRDHVRIFLTVDGEVLYTYSTYRADHLSEDIEWAQNRGYGMEILPKRDALYKKAVTVVLYR